MAEAIEDAVLPVLDRLGCDLVYATFRRERGGHVLRLFIERRGADPDQGSGVDLALCSAVSRDAGPALDAADAISHAYTLEVSSPGLERPLGRLEDFRRFAGRAAVVRTREPVAGTRTLRGTLGLAAGDDIVLEDTDGRRTVVPWRLVERANLVYQPKSGSRKEGAR